MQVFFVFFQFFVKLFYFKKYIFAFHLVNMII